MSKFKTVTNHIYANRAKYAAAATLTVCVAVQLQGAKVWNQFLADHNLTEEFYSDES